PGASAAPSWHGHRRFRHLKGREARSGSWRTTSDAVRGRGLVGRKFESRVDRGGTMASLTSVLIEPVYRWVYGRPSIPTGAVVAEDAGGEMSPVRGLVLVADGVGGLELCGTALRYVAGAEGLPYAVELVPWGHGFGQWYADLTDEANRDQQARLVAE